METAVASVDSAEIFQFEIALAGGPAVDECGAISI